MFENVIAKIAGKWIAKKTNLQEGPMDTKQWYESKTIWTAVIGALVGIYGAISSVHPLPPIPSWIYSLLGAAGLYGLRTADTKIG